MKRINVVIIGYGGMGHWHGEHLIWDSKKYNLKGIYDIDEKRCQLARDEGTFVYDSLEAVLRDETVELVTIAAYNEVHKPLAIAAMESGKNVVCEKPVTLSIKDLDEMIAVSEKTGKMFTVHQNRRWDSDFLTAKKIIENNVLGSTFRIEHRVQGSRGIPKDWRSEKEHGGGMVYDWGVHLIDQMLYMNDNNKIKSVYANLTNVTNAECDDGCYITLTFENGLVALLEVATNNFITLPMWYVLAENGTAVIEDWDLKGKMVMVEDWENADAVPIKAGQGLTKTMAPRNDDSIKEFELPIEKGDWGGFYDNVYDVLVNGKEQIVTHRQIRRVLSVIEAVFESAKNNEVVKVDL